MLGIQGSGFRDRVRVQGLGYSYKVPGLWFRVYGSGSKI